MKLASATSHTCADERTYNKARKNLGFNSDVLNPSTDVISGKYIGDFTLGYCLFVQVQLQLRYRDIGCRKKSSTSSPKIIIRNLAKLPKGASPNPGCR